MNDTFNNGRIFCTKCGTANKAGYRFCVKCGEKLVVLASKPEPEISQELPKTEPVRSETVNPEPQPTFSAFEQSAPTVKPEPAVFDPEPVKAEPQPIFDAFEQASPAAKPAEPSPVEPSAFEPEPAKAEPQPTFGAFEQSIPAAVEPKAFEQAAPAEPVRPSGFARNGRGAFEPEPESDYTGFARSGFTGATTPTAAAGAFATAVDAVRNNKQIDVSDAETVMSLLEPGESSALAEGLPAWDIVPPQVVVRRKHRL